jgi:photosystem II stability/assembly factor-like uncharacterized protein
MTFARPGWRIAVISAIVTLTVTSLAAASLASSARGTTWQERGLFPSVRDVPGKVVCPSPSLCVAIPATNRPDTPFIPEILRSTDGGRVWARANVTPIPQVVLYDLSCASSTSCVAVGAGFSTKRLYFFRSTDGGADWSSTSVDLASTLGVAGAASVSCATATDCLVFASQSDVSDLTWPQPKSWPPLEFVTKDGGATWAQSSPLASLHQPYVTGLSCPTNMTCEAVGTAVVASRGYSWDGRTTNGGASWSIVHLPKDVDDPTALSCGSSTFCVALAGQGVGNKEARTVNGGRSWATSSIPLRIALPEAIDCLASGTCYVGGYWVPTSTSTEGLLVVSHDFGATWVRRSMPPSSGDLVGISCAASASCLLFGDAVGEIDESAGVPQVLILDAAGVHLVRASIDSWFDPRGLVCTSTVRCLSVGGAASAYGEVATVKETSTAGRTWSTSYSLHQVSGLRAITCMTASRCVAIGWVQARTVNGIVLETADAGRSWRVVDRVVGRENTLTDVACPTRTTCLAVGSTDAALRSTDGGAHWSRVVLPQLTGSETVLACSTSSVCVANGTDLVSRGNVAYVTTNAGATWSPSPFAPSFATGLTCPTVLRCITLSRSYDDARIVLSSDGGLTWSPAPVVPRMRALRSVSCLGPTWCIAVGAATRPAILVSRDGGMRWNPLAAPPGLSELAGAWCGPSGCWVSGTRTGSGATELAREP